MDKCEKRIGEIHEEISVKKTYGGSFENAMEPDFNSDPSQTLGKSLEGKSKEIIYASLIKKKQRSLGEFCHRVSISIKIKYFPISFRISINFYQDL